MDKEVTPRTRETEFFFTHDPHSCKYQKSCLAREITSLSYYIENPLFMSVTDLVYGKGELYVKNWGEMNMVHIYMYVDGVPVG